jgi:hypothetical protein
VIKMRFTSYLAGQCMCHRGNESLPPGCQRDNVDQKTEIDI